MHDVTFIYTYYQLGQLGQSDVLTVRSYSEQKKKKKGEEDQCYMSTMNQDMHG